MGRDTTKLLDRQLNSVPDLRHSAIARTIHVEWCKVAVHADSIGFQSENNRER